MLISTKNLEEARRKILELNKKGEQPIIVEAQNLEFNRKILEYGKFHILLSPEFSSDTNKPHLKKINSGINHILAKIASKNKIAIGIDLKKIRSLEKKEKALALMKLMEILKVCRKAKCSLTLLNFKDKKDASAFLLSLGASTEQTTNF